jgi:hypothetical protein
MFFGYASGWVWKGDLLMRTLTTLLTATALIATLLPGSAFAAGNRHRSARDVEPVVQQAPPPNPAGAVVGGAVIGAIIGAVVCPPCAIAGTALASGGGALVGGGIGAVSGGVVATAAAQQQPRRAYY